LALLRNGLDSEENNGWNIDFDNEFIVMASLVVYRSEFLTTDHEVMGSIPGSTMEIFP
jgi:hypothetical protein